MNTSFYFVNKREKGKVREVYENKVKLKSKGDTAGEVLSMAGDWLEDILDDGLGFKSLLFLYYNFSLHYSRSLIPSCCRYSLSGK